MDFSRCVSGHPCRQKTCQELNQIVQTWSLGSQDRCVLALKLSQDLKDQGLASMVKRMFPRIGIIVVSFN